MAALDIATLVIYAIFVQPTIYIIWRHGKRGILGWFYAHAFCILRIVGSILDIVQGSSSSTSFSVLIVSNIGLSPLLLASLGVLHEARQARYANLRNRLEWFLIIQYHCVISAAMALIIVGITRLENGQDAEATKSIFLKIGMTIVVLCWLVLLVWGLISLPRPKDIKIATYSNGSILLYGVILAVPLVGIRMIYGICSFFITSSSFSTSLAAKVCLSTVPEMITILILIVVGLKTHKMWRRTKTSSLEVESH